MDTFGIQDYCYIDNPDLLTPQQIKTKADGAIKAFEERKDNLVKLLGDYHDVFENYVKRTANLIYNEKD